MEIHQPSNSLNPEDYVSSLNTLTGDVTLAAGTNITITPAGNTLTIASTSSPGGSDTQVQFNDSGTFGGDAGFTYNKTTDSAALVGDLTVADEAYGAGWNGSLEVPTKNAVYDKVETLFILPSLTAGSVLFSNGTTIAQDNANFFWDDTNNRLGIGTATPSAPLHIKGTNATAGTNSLNIVNSNSDNLLSIDNDSNATLGFYTTGVFRDNIFTFKGGDNTFSFVPYVPIIRMQNAGGQAEGGNNSREVGKIEWYSTGTKALELIGKYGNVGTTVGSSFRFGFSAPGGTFYSDALVLACASHATSKMAIVLNGSSTFGDLFTATGGAIRCKTESSGANYNEIISQDQGAETVMDANNPNGYGTLSFYKAIANPIMQFTIGGTSGTSPYLITHANSNKPKMRLGASSAFNALFGTVNKTLQIENDNDKTEVLIKGGSAQSTAYYLEVQNSSATSLMRVDSLGAIYNRLTTKQQQWEYDASNYANLTVNSTGSATLDLVGTTPTFTFSDPVTINGLLTLSAQNIATDTTTGMKIGTGTTQKLGFYNAAPVVQPTALTTQLTTVTCSAPGTPDYAVQDLVAAIGFGFVTADEGQSVLKVIANLQVRVAELESKIQSLGLLA